MAITHRSSKNSPSKARFSRRRGLTTVVTTALMLSTVAVLGSSLVAWSNGNLRVFETALSTTASKDTNKLTESLNVENVVFCHSCNTTDGDNVINVTLTNTGTVGITVNSISVNGSTIQNYAKGSILPVNLLPSQSYTVAAQLPLGTTWQSDSLDTITVTTARNSIYTTEASPP